MHQHLKKSYSYLAIGILGFALYILQYSGILPIIGGCYPVLLLPFVIICSAFFGAVPGTIIGAAVGTVMDIYTGSSPYFHLIVLSVIGCACGLLITYLLNHNWQAMTILTVGFCLLYFFVRWLWFYSSPGAFVSYFLTTGVLSALYTAILSVPVYWLVRWTLHILENAERR